MRQNNEGIMVSEQDSKTVKVIKVASSVGVTCDDRDTSTAYKPPGDKT